MLRKSGCISAPPFPIWAACHKEERKSKAKQREKPTSSLLAARLQSRDPGAAAELGLPRPVTGAASLAENHRLSRQSNRRHFFVASCGGFPAAKELEALPPPHPLMQHEEALPEGSGTVARVCTKGLNALELLQLKNKAERLWHMTEGLAACFSQTMEMVQKRPVEPWTNIRLILQSDGKWLELRAGQIKQTMLVWYDPHTSTVRKHRMGASR
ncbi:uncharacterized protein LOC128848415 isoform X1 [Malaclemys terrapin pileata]|uniref:uncharacterized protein LOC128848415 isoform X1 n=1 Tax=Malaclemys terrapin pileata TaxID=2991368 RepID=UPI0023A8C26B|nr:uncharacterized protein LOC128848415 isoform X1 [Malaclemys terrapin pileata]